MTIQQPTSTNFLNNPDHALSHRIFANDDSAPVKSIVVDASGNIGINQETPTATLHLEPTAVGTIGLRLKGITDQTADMLVIENDSGTDLVKIEDDGKVTFQNDTDSTSGFQILDADGGTPIFNVDTTNERIGIGTASPISALQVVGAISDSPTSAGVHMGVSGGNFAAIQLFHSQGGFIDFSDGSGEDGDYRIIEASGIFQIRQGVSTPVFSINSSGRATIGTTTFLTNEADLLLDENGILAMKETTTPTADTNFGKVYTKNDDKIYFQDGAGAEHEIAFV